MDLVPTSFSCPGMGPFHNSSWAGASGPGLALAVALSEGVKVLPGLGQPRTLLGYPTPSKRLQTAREPRELLGKSGGSSEQ